MTDLKTRVEQAAQTQSNRPDHDYLVNDLWREILSLREQLAARTADDVKCEAPDVAITALMSTHTPGPWCYIPATEYHGPYVTSDFGSTICDCYTMSQPSLLSTASGGPSKPVLFLAEMADPNARLIAAAPDLLEALRGVVAVADRQTDEFDKVRAAIAKAVELT